MCRLECQDGASQKSAVKAWAHEPIIATSFLFRDRPVACLPVQSASVSPTNAFPSPALSHRQIRATALVRSCLLSYTTTTALPHSPILLRARSCNHTITAITSSSTALLTPTTPPATSNTDVISAPSRSAVTCKRAPPKSRHPPTELRLRPYTTHNFNNTRACRISLAGEEAARSGRRAGYGPPRTENAW